MKTCLLLVALSSVLLAVAFSGTAANQVPRTPCQINNVVLGGGGISIYAGAGAIAALRASPRYNLTSVTATNDGAILATLIVANYSDAEIEGLLFASGTPPRPLDYETVGANIVNFSGVFYVQDEYQGLIELLLISKYGVPGMTFGQLFQATGKFLNFVVYNCNLRRLEYLNKDTTPDLAVSLGAAASLAYTYIYDTVTIDDYIYTSGAVRNNYPIDYYPPTLGNRLVGVNYVYDYNTVDWNYNDTAAANVVVGATNLLNYLINPSINTPVLGSPQTVNVYITPGVIQYSHYLTDAQKLELIAEGNAAMTQHLTNPLSFF